MAERLAHYRKFCSAAGDGERRVLCTEGDCSLCEVGLGRIAELAEHGALDGVAVNLAIDLAALMLDHRLVDIRAVASDKAAGKTACRSAGNVTGILAVVEVGIGVSYKPADLGRLAVGRRNVGVLISHLAGVLAVGYLTVVGAAKAAEADRRSGFAGNRGAVLGIAENEAALVGAADTADIRQDTVTGDSILEQDGAGVLDVIDGGTLGHHTEDTAEVGLGGSDIGIVGGNTVEGDGAAVGTVVHIGLEITADTARIHGLALGLDVNRLLVMAVLHVCRRSTHNTAEAHLGTSGINHVALEIYISLVGAVFDGDTLVAAIGCIRRERTGIAEYAAEGAERGVTAALGQGRTTGEGGFDGNDAEVVAVGSIAGHVTCYAADAGVGGCDVESALVADLTVIIGILELAFDDTGHATHCRIASGATGGILPLDVALVGTALHDTVVGSSFLDGRSLADDTADAELLHAL